MSRLTRRRARRSPGLALGLAAGLAFSWLAAGAGAQDSTPAPDSTESPERAAQASPYYATATVYARPLSSATASVTLIERKDIEATGAPNVAELLRQTPGIQLLDSGTRGGLTAAQIRGGDPNFTLVLLDGVPLNDSTDPQGGAVNLQSLPTAGIERIEILRGPVSDFYGSTGLAGVVNIVTRAGSGHGHAQASFETGNASLLHAVGSLDGTLGAGSQFLTASWERESHRVAEEGFEQIHLYGTAKVPIGGERRLDLAIRESVGATDDYPEGSGGPRYSSGGLRHSDTLELSLSAEAALGADEDRPLKLAATLFGRILDRDSPGVAPQVPPSTEKTRYLHGRLGAAGTVLSAGEMRIDAGADLNWEHAANESVLQLPPELGGDVPGDYERTRLTPGVYAGLLLERGRLIVEAASRVDLPEGKDAQLSPRLGLSYRPSGGSTRLRLSAGRAYKLPSFFALASPPQLGGNPDLHPESSLGVDVGAEHDFGPSGLHAELSLFYERFHDLIDFDFETFREVNRTQVESRGAELAVGARLAAALRLDSSLTLLRVEDVESGDRLLHRPEWTGGARLRWTPRTHLSLSLDGQAVSSSADQQIPAPDRHSVPGHVLFGLSGTWSVAEHWRLDVRLDNLTDRRYETLIGFPGPGRAARVGIHWQLY
jgi:vitamin B12 transporter